VPSTKEGLAVGIHFAAGGEAAKAVRRKAFVEAFDAAL
jgi:hypothetical protein